MSKRLTIPEVLPFAKAYYQLPGNSCGGNLHIVLDDGNLSNEDIKFCLDLCIEAGDKEGVKLATMILKLSKTQRNKLWRLV